jgi:hypothetical protein
MGTWSPIIWWYIWGWPRTIRWVAHHHHYHHCCFIIQGFWILNDKGVTLHVPTGMGRLKGKQVHHHAVCQSIICL